MPSAIERFVFLLNQQTFSELIDKITFKKLLLQFIFFKS